MGFTELLTIVFIVLKLIGIIDWKWIFVILPELIAAGFYMLYILFWIWQLYRIKHDDWL